MPRKTAARSRSARLGGTLNVSDGFRAFALDQLEQLRPVTPRAMFGGIGLYHEDLFFGILAGDMLYLKADGETRPRFERAGALAFKPYQHRSSTMPYYSVPLSVLEDLHELGRWVADALDAATRSRLRATGAGRRTASPRTRPR